MIEEALIAFILIYIPTMAIYTLGKRSAPKTTISENVQAAYACGEKLSIHGSKNNVSLYQYLGIILAAGIVLVEGGKE